MRLKPRSLKNQLLLCLFLIAVFVFIVTELVFIEKSRRSLTKMLDINAMTYASQLAARAAVAPDGKIELNLSDQLLQDLGSHASHGRFLVLRAADTSEIERSESLKDKNIVLPDRLSRIPRGKAHYWSTKINGGRVRFVGLREAVRMEKRTEESKEGISHEESSPVSGRAGTSVDTDKNECLFIVGLDQRYIGKRLHGTIEATAPVLAIGLALMLLLGWIVINQGLEPLRGLEQEVKAISSSSMTPVTVPGNKELAAVATTLNAMIGNLKESFERERRFTANVAHELRTRISEMRSLSEVALRFEDDLDEDNRKNYEDILASAKEMQETFVNLLTLARCHSGQLKPRKDTVTLQELISSMWKKQAGAASARAITVRCDVPADLRVVTDKDLLEAILQNLFSNAVSYATVSGTIEWEAHAHGDEFSLSVSNSVENLSEQDLLHMFEPFWQKNEARTSGDSHSGLGLCLVQSLAQVLGLSVNAHLTTPTLLTITLSGKTTQAV